MLKVNYLMAHRTFCGVHPLTGEVIRCRWKDVPYEILLTIWEGGESNQREIFTKDSTPDKVKAIKEQPNVNTTAPSTTATRITTTTAKASTGTISE